MSTPRTFLQRKYFWPLAIAGLIIAASSRSQVAGPSLPHIDKVVHFSIYGLLATTLCRIGQGWRAGLWALALASAFGVTDEWHQAFVPGREPSVADWIADTLGAATAVALYVGWGWYRRLLEMPVGRRRRGGRGERGSKADSTA